jgi:endonuclease YncB( thermonuclease family)
MKRLLFFVFISFICSFVYSQSYSGTIIRVVDGDTYIFQTEEGSFTVRMQGTDAPERDQPFSKESAEFLSNYLHKDAVIKINGTDRYRRRLGTLFIDGQDINLISIKGGYSWHFKRYSSDQQYASAEESARKNKLGLWSLPNSIAPWNWRKEN